MADIATTYPGDAAASVFIIVCALAGIGFAVYLYLVVKSVKIDTEHGEDEGAKLISSQEAELDDVPNDSAASDDQIRAIMNKMVHIYEIIVKGAKAFLMAEYKLCAIFVVSFGLIVFFMVSHVSGGSWDWRIGGLTALSFVIGSVISCVSGWIGMMVAVYSNVRTTKQAMNPSEEAAWMGSFNTAFRAGGVMGYSLCGVALLFLYMIISFYQSAFPIGPNISDRIKNAKLLFECVAGFGLGGSSIALFGRVGGGIYTKAADVGADLAGKVVKKIPEDDPRNPAVIADNVGDNVGDVAGMGSDLFGSFGESTCAALVISSVSPELLNQGLSALMFPLFISALGILVCAATSFLATHVYPVKSEALVEKVLKIQLGGATLLMTILLIPLCYLCLPQAFHLSCHLESVSYTAEQIISNTDGVLDKNCWVNIASGGPGLAFVCVGAGLWGGCIIGFITEYYTSNNYKPVKEVAQSTETGAATNIIYGLALGYNSVIVPVAILALIVFISFSLLDMYGVALAALGMLSILATCLSIDVYGPVCDNAGGIAEMAGCASEVRDKTDALDAAGNTTAAIGKGFAIGSAALVSLALFGAFVTRTGFLETYGVNLLRPIDFAFLLIGAMLPYWFTAMTMKSVGKAAMEMVKEVKRQFDTIPGLMEGENSPDYEKCIEISTKASLREMILPGILVIFAPIVTGTLFGVEAVTGLLAGGLTSGVQMAISQSNSGGAWDNAKKLVEKGLLEVEIMQEDGSTQLEVQGKGTDCHAAAVVGDTVGDPLKDTSGPALNILMKLMAIISLVFADFFISINGGNGILNIESWQTIAQRRFC